MGGGNLQSVAVKVALGGAVYGFIEKTIGDKLPTIPVLGKAGTIALVGVFLKPTGMLRDATVAAATIAGFQLGRDGKIAGDD